MQHAIIILLFDVKVEEVADFFSCLTCQSNIVILSTLKEKVAQILKIHYPLCKTSRPRRLLPFPARALLHPLTTESSNKTSSVLRPVLILLWAIIQISNTNPIRRRRCTAPDNGEALQKSKIWRKIQNSVEIFMYKKPWSDLCRLHENRLKISIT